MPLFIRKKKAQGKAADLPRTYPVWLIALTWVISFLMIAMMGFALFQYFTGKSLMALIQTVSWPAASTQAPSELPEFDPARPYDSVARSTDPETILPTGSRDIVTEYQVESGDTLFGLAENYSLEPESILWANFNVLQDNPHLISLGVTLKIPPVDGILYQWKEDDKLDHIAGLYKVNVEDILLYPGNDLDITNPVIEPGAYIMIPGGYRPMEQNWIVPLQSADVSGGTTAVINGPGSCTPSAVYYGSLAFGWPAPYPGEVTGNDYWGGHPAIDAMCFEGDGIYASDSGVVIYAGPISGGYGNMIAIDHGNGYVTIYAHLSNWYVQCGNIVNKGAVIGACGSSGNSTGAHLHFEIRQGGDFLNPWFVLQ
ncbi:MAG TPA: LysM peptidoglycan-binding domain-containing M23 family metallopeptidase [Pelolinea sp.]|nr:LysM peptidoglycan-binding domain-containing M23 family metallopeptidase [Pelolinea sp.]